MSTVEPAVDSPYRGLEPLTPAADSAESPLRVFWRYKALLMVLAAAGASFGYWRFLQKPTTYGAATQLMIKSERPLILDKESGRLMGGVPSSDILTALIQSDKIMMVAGADPDIVSLGAFSGRSTGELANIVRSGISFRPQTTAGGSERMIVNLSYSGNDPDLCVASVNATSRAIQAYFNSERESSVDRLSALIEQAEGKLLPQLTELETKYQAFRANNRLEWNERGEVVNPHRERQAQLHTQVLEIENDRRRLTSDLRLIETFWNKNKDLDLVMYLIAQSGGGPRSSMAGLTNNLPGSGDSSQSVVVPELRDLELEQLSVEQSLVPLLIEQQQLVVELGSGHPAVRTLEAQVMLTRKKLNELSEQRSRRIEQLAEERRKANAGSAETVPDGEPSEADMRLFTNWITTVKGKLEVLEMQRGELEVVIEQEKKAAASLSQSEKDDEMFRRQIARMQSMLVQLEEQMASVDVNAVNQGVVVEPLLGAVQAGITGPDLKQDVIMWGMLGLALGAGIGFLFDSNSRMFRSSEQVSAALQSPVLTHVPLDENFLSRRKSQKTDESGKPIDPTLAVVHRPESATAEAMRCVRTAILFHAGRTGEKVFQITSPLPGDGKSTLAANLASSLAIAGKKVLLVDLDLRSPRLTARFGLEKVEGMTNLLNGDCDPRSAIHETAVKNLEILPCGKLPSNPAEALSLPEMVEAFDWFRDHYDFIIVDTPPLLLVTDPAIVTSYVDQTLLVMRLVRACKPNSIESMGILRGAGANVLGILINKVDEVAVGKYYQVGGNGSYRSVGYGYSRKYRSERKKSRDIEEYVVRGGSSQIKNASATPLNDSAEHSASMNGKETHSPGV
jgi:succinoglycan biosynthesis transport protein ExoP